MVRSAFLLRAKKGRMAPLRRTALVILALSACSRLRLRRERAGVYKRERNRISNINRQIPLAHGRLAWPKVSD